MIAMNEPAMSLTLDGQRRNYAPGETLAGTVRLHNLADDDLKSIELSVLWYTEGQGDEDMAVHFFERIMLDDEGQRQLHSGHSFRTLLPNSPLSYEGVLMKIFWCVRARAFRGQGKELVAEQPFRLGNVPPVPIPAGES
jgi:hypothetical protein